MTTKPISVLVFSLFLLTTASAYVPIPDDMIPGPELPDYDFGPMFITCYCMDGETEICDAGGGCLGSRECSAPGPSCLDSGDCGADACTGNWGECVKSDLCCGVDCASNEECDDTTGDCKCADNKEKCGSGTGDGIDNDCDGDVDEGCATCSAGTVKACDDDGCAGTQTCKAAGVWGVCKKTVPCCGVTCDANELCNPSNGNCVCKDSVERCLQPGVGDGIDNNCDGQIDETCATAAPADTGAGTGNGTGTGTGTGTGGGAIACPADAKLCPDGSTVGRVPPTCQFAPCPAGVTGGAGQGTGGIGPGGGTGTGQQSGGVDMNLVMVLVIVVVAGIMGLIAILLLKRKPQGAAPAQPKAPGA